MTSNVGSEILQRNVSMGFGSHKDADSDYDATKDKIMEEAKKTFRPEFLNRIDDMVIFRKLSVEHITKITELEIQKLRERVRQKGYRIRVSTRVKEFLIEEGYDEKMGARPLRRAVERHLEDTLAEAILAEEIENSENKFLVAKIKDGEVYFEPASETPPQKKNQVTETKEKD